jgi:ferric-dicitrate binding protein FerR (iron transport regulator)
MKKYGLVLVVIAAVSMSAAEQMGTVSGQGITLRGAPVPGTAESLPVLSGDEIVTGAQAATLTLPGNSVITLGANSQIWPELQKGQTMICLARGAVQFRAAAGSRITICALGRPVVLEPGSEGTVTIEGPDRVYAKATVGAVQVQEGATCGCVAMPAAQKKGWTAKKVAVVVGVAGGAAAGTAIGLAVAGAPQPVSPSKP